MKCVIPLAALVILSSNSAEAQEIASKFDQLRVLLKQGDTVTITDAQGIRTQGRLAQLSQSSISLSVDGAMRQFQEAGVDTIARRAPDSLQNGALTGMVIGGGLAALAIGTAVPGSEAGWVAIGALLYGGIGAGLGAGIDALIEGRRVIYARSPSTRATLGVSPILRDRNKGVMVSLRWKPVLSSPSTSYARRESIKRRWPR